MTRRRSRIELIFLPGFSTTDKVSNISGRGVGIDVVKNKIQKLNGSDVGVLMQFGNNNFILSADGFAGHDDVVIKPLDTFRPKGVAGVTMSSEGDIVLILDIKELLEDLRSSS